MIVNCLDCDKSQILCIICAMICHSGHNFNGPRYGSEKCNCGTRCHMKNDTSKTTLSFTFMFQEMYHREMGDLVIKSKDSEFKTLKAIMKNYDYYNALFKYENKKDSISFYYSS